MSLVSTSERGGDRDFRMGWDYIEKCFFFLCNWDWISITFWIMTSFTTTIFFMLMNFYYCCFLIIICSYFESWQLTVLKRSNSSTFPQPLPPPPPFFFFLSVSLRIIMGSSIPLVMVSELNPLIKNMIFLLLFTPRGGQGCLMSPSVWNLRASHLIPLSYLLTCFFCLDLLPFLSCHFSANDLFSWVFFPENSQIIFC